MTDFREACCRQNDMGECGRGGFCNFMHLKSPRGSLVRELHAQQRTERKVNPSAKDLERQKEMAEFNEKFGAPAGDAPPPAAESNGKYHERDRDYRGGGDRDRDHRSRRDYDDYDQRRSSRRDDGGYDRRY